MRPTNSMEAVLPILGHLKSRGLLVPFIGAGMSMKACRGWEGFVQEIEQLAGNESAARAATEGTSADSDALVRRANASLRTLRLRSESDAIEAVRKALYESADHIPRQTELLAAHHWPLVVSTNYDDIYLRALAATTPAAGGSLRIPMVLGRSDHDVQVLLNALHSPTRPLLWAIQGFLPSERAVPKVKRRANATTKDEDYEPLYTVNSSDPVDSSTLDRLAGELVVGHAEYRRVTHREVHFRRAFAELFRSRSLLFLGSGMSEPYFLDMFSEIRELAGENPFPHFAFVERAKGLDAGFLRSRFGITLVEYDAHAAVEDLLSGISSRGATTGTKGRSITRQVSWTFRHHRDPEHTSTIDVVIEEDELPPDVPDDAMIAFSGGLDSVGLHLSGGILKAARKLLKNDKLLADAGRRIDGTLLFRFPGQTGDDQHNVVAAVPWHDETTRDVYLINRAMGQLLALAEAHGKKALHVGLLGAGATRRFPGRVALAQMLRAVRDHSAAALQRVIVHVIDEDVLSDLRSGSIDPAEILAIPEVRGWVEVYDSEGRLVDRELRFIDPALTVGQLAGEFGVTFGDVIVELEPARLSSASTEETIPLAAEMSVIDVGLVPGSVVRLRRRSASTTNDAKHSGPRPRRPAQVHSVDSDEPRR